MAIGAAAVRANHSTLEGPRRFFGGRSDCLYHAHGYRNAQATVLAPTGKIGLLMDCDTTGIEPDFALVKFKKLAGGGYFKIVNQTVPRALRRLGYTEREVQEIVAYVSGTNTVLATPHINRRTLKERGLTDAEIRQVDRFVREHTTDKFGPVRVVEPHLVFELAFENLQIETRRPGTGPC